MKIVIGLIILLFFNYYFLCKNYSKRGNKFIFGFFFVFTSIILRILIDPSSSKDYIGYYEFYNFDNSAGLTSFLVSEPYLFLLYKFFHFFVVDKSLILVCVFWFNWVLCMYFYVWLAFRDDLELWKKITIFAFYFFLFSFVVIRNAPVYIIYSYFFYYSYRAIKYKSTIITPLMHLSSLPLLLLLFHKEKNYFKYMVIGLLFFLVLFIFKFLPIFENIDALESPLNKIDTYLEDTKQKSFFHQIYFGFISGLFILSWIIFRKQLLHPILITTLLIYYITFFINPIIGFRYSPYVILAIFLTNFESKYELKFVTEILNTVILVLLPYFIYTYYETHYL
jgi:hypothetical protein